MQEYIINSENSSDHWRLLSIKDKNVLDLGCGRWYGVEQENEYSPLYFERNGASQVIAVDELKEEIEFYKQKTNNSNKFIFLERKISSPNDIINILNEFPTIDCIKCDIEGAETNFFTLEKEIFTNISDIAIEFHSTEIKNTLLSKLVEWGFFVNFISKFSFAGDHVGVIFASKTIIVNKKYNIANIICTTSAITAFYKSWKENLKFDNNDYILCDTVSGLIPSQILLDFVQDNVIYYDKFNVKKYLDVNFEPPDNHWWNLGGGRSLLWFYPYLRMLYFYKVNPDYDYYWFFDDDVTFPDNNLQFFLESHNVLEYDFMATYLFTQGENQNQPNVLVMDNTMNSFHDENFNWLIHYPGNGDSQLPTEYKKYGSYFPIVKLSKKAMEILSKIHLDGLYGYGEGFVPTILAAHNCSLYSIFDKNSKIKIDSSIIVHHKNWEMLWKNI